MCQDFLYIQYMTIFSFLTENKWIEKIFSNVSLCLQLSLGFSINKINASIIIFSLQSVLDNVQKGGRFDSKGLIANVREAEKKLGPGH